MHAHRFRETLSGDVLRGVRVGLEDREGRLTRLGALKSCQWTVFRHDVNSTRQNNGEDKGAIAEDYVGERASGIYVVVEFERNTHTALILRKSRPASDEKGGETHLPLLLTRMPAPLRDAFLDYLATTFDTRAEIMRLSDNYISNALEAFLGEISKHGPDQLERAVKDVQVTLSFKVPATPSLKSLDITIRREDLMGFLNRGGRIIDSQRNGQSRAGEKRDKRDSDYRNDWPFMAALSEYLRFHLAIDIGHERVSISRVACAGFILSSEGKAKIFAPYMIGGLADPNQIMRTPTQNAVASLVHQLLDRAKGSLD